MPDKREQIMRAAEKLFASRRFHEITTDDIAREAHVGKGTIYRYFKDKDDLFLQTATSGFETLCELLRHQPSSGDVRTDLIAACERIGGFFRRRRQLFGMMQAEESRTMFSRQKGGQAWHERRRQLVEALAEVIGRGVATGEIRADLPPDVLAVFLLSLLRARARELAEAAEQYRSDEAVVAFFLQGAAAGAVRETVEAQGAAASETGE